MSSNNNSNTNTEANLIKQNFQLRKQIDVLQETIKANGSKLSFANNRIKQLESKFETDKRRNKIRNGQQALPILDAGNVGSANDPG